MSLEQAAAFGEAATLNASNNEIFAAVENLDRGIAILEKHLNRTQNSGKSNSNVLSPTAVEIEKSELRARLFDFLSRKADLLLSSGGTSAALNTSLLMCSTDPRNPQGFFVAGQALRKLKRYEQAVDYLATASKLDNNQSIQIRQCLELAITELRMPSSVEMLNNSGLNVSNGFYSPAGIAGASSASASRNNNTNDEFDFDVESVLRFAQKYVPTASQLKKQAKEKPAQAAGACVGILVLLMILISFETIMFGICFGIVIALHKWEKRVCSQRGIILYRVPVLEVPLNVLTCAFLSVSAVYFLLM